MASVYMHPRHPAAARTAAPTLGRGDTAAQTKHAAHTVRRDSCSPEEGRDAEAGLNRWKRERVRARGRAQAGMSNCLNSNAMQLVKHGSAAGQGNSARMEREGHLGPGLPRLPLGGDDGDDEYCRQSHHGMSWPWGEHRWAGQSMLVHRAPPGIAPHRAGVRQYCK